MLGGFSTILFISCFSKAEPDLPSFNLLMADSINIFNTGNIRQGKVSVLFYFSPDCEHCQKETVDLLKHMPALKNVQFYFVTNDPLDRLKVYNSYYKIFRHLNIIIGRDYTFFFLRYFKGATPPYLIIYDKNKRQRAVFKGESNISDVVSFINQL
jgi:thiol-disulfide isomerase/thioredoxin